MDRLKERGARRETRAARAAGTQDPTATHPPSTIRYLQSLTPLAFGLLASVALLAFYLGVISLSQDRAHALEQLQHDRWFVGAIALGFGVQIGLFAHLRHLHARAAAGGVAVSTGTSTTAMLACCAHHLTDVLPIVGLSGAAIFLNDYRTPLLWLGIVMNVAGILYLLWKIVRQRPSAIAQMLALETRGNLRRGNEQ